MGSGLRPFYLITVLWGDEFRRVFVELCLPSLLAPSNIPALEGRDVNRFLLCTTEEDWRLLSKEPMFRRLAGFIRPEFVEIRGPSHPKGKYAAMSDGHRIAVERAFAAKAYGIFISPDTMLSDGSLSHLQTLAAAGTQCVLAAALRFSTEAFVTDLDRRGLRHPGRPISLSGRDLARVALPHMHPETARYDWDSPHFSHFPVCCFWRVPEGMDAESGIVLHSQSWGPMLVDYRQLEQHDGATFESWTLDGDYIYRNFGRADRVHVIRDSDDLLYVSFTPEAERREPLVRNLAKGASLRALTFGPLMDPLKRQLFGLSIRLHGGPLGDAWAIAEKRAASILERELHPPSVLERAWIRYRIFGWKGFIPQAWRPWLRPFRRLWHRLAAG